MPSRTLPKSYVVFCILFLLFSLTRLIILFKSPHIFHPEETYRGCVAQGIMGGLKFNLLDYQYTHYEGGTLAMGMQLIPIFKIFGAKIMSLKMVALAYAAGILFLIYFLLYRCFDLKTAVIGGLLFVFAPPYFLVWNFLALGGYHENIFFMFLSLYLFHLFLFTNHKSKRLILSLGLVCGVAAWSHAGFFIAFVIILLTWLTRDPASFLSGSLFLFILSFLSAYSPAIIYNLKFDGGGIKYFAEAFIGDGNILKPSVLIGKLQTLITIDLPMSLQFRDVGYSYFYYGLAVFSFIFIVCRHKIYLMKFFRSAEPVKDQIGSDKKQWLESVVVLYVGLHIFAYLVSEFKANPYGMREMNGINYYEHIVAVQPFMLLSIAIFLHYFMDIIKGRKLLWAVGGITAFFILTTGILGVKDVIGTGSNTLKLNGPAFDYKLLHVAIGHKYRDNLGYFQSLENRISTDYKPYFYYGLGLGVGDSLEYGKPLSIIERQIGMLDQNYVKYLYIAMGTENGGFEGERFLKNGIPRVNIRHSPYYLLGLSLSDKITGEKRFPNPTDLLKGFPENERKTISLFIRSLNSFVIPYQCSWQRKDRDILRLPSDDAAL